MSPLLLTQDTHSTSGHQRCAFPPTKQFTTPAGCPTIELDSDTTYLEMASDPTGEGLCPTRLLPAPHQTPTDHTLDANHKSSLSPGLLTNWLQTGGSHDPLFRFDEFTRAAHRTRGNTYLHFTSLTKGIIKDTDEQRDEETPRARSGRIPGTGLCPRRAGVHLPPGVDVFANLEAPKPPTSGIFMEDSSHRQDQLLSLFPAPLPSLEDRARVRGED